MIDDYPPGIGSLVSCLAAMAGATHEQMRHPSAYGLRVIEGHGFTLEVWRSWLDKLEECESAQLASHGECEELVAIARKLQSYQEFGLNWEQVLETFGTMITPKLTPAQQQRLVADLRPPYRTITVTLKRREINRPTRTTRTARPAARRAVRVSSGSRKQDDSEPAAPPEGLKLGPGTLEIGRHADDSADSEGSS